MPIHLGFLAQICLCGCVLAGTSQTGAIPAVSDAPLTVSQKETDMSTPISLAGNTARDGQIAIREEFDAAVAKGTAAALEFFIRRHPDNVLTAEAKTRLKQLQQNAND